MMKPRLGQHFLRSKTALDAIVRAAELTPHDMILEIGPGTGILTEKLLTQSDRIVAIEKDRLLVESLKKRFGNEIRSGKLTLVENDILDFAPEEYVHNSEPYKLVANIPYYITGAILEKFLSGKMQPTKAVLLVQKEVAVRVMGDNAQKATSHSKVKPQKESLLSISVKAFGTPRYVKTVKAGAFSPPPRVDSAILAIETISRDFFKDIDEQLFFKLVRTGFAHKRKRLVNNLKHLVPHRLLTDAGIAENARAEDVSLKAWGALVRLAQQNSAVEMR